MLIEEIIEKNKEIVGKEFKSTLNGYKKNDVDIFLDELVEFNEHIISRLEANEKEGDEMVRENLKLKNQVVKLDQQISEVEKSKNLDMLVLKQQLSDMQFEISKLKTIKE